MDTACYCGINASFHQQSLLPCYNFFFLSFLLKRYLYNTFTAVLLTKIFTLYLRDISLENNNYVLVKNFALFIRKQRVFWFPCGR